MTMSTANVPIVNTSLDGTASEILKNSFAVYKVPPTVAVTIQAAWKEAASLLDDDSRFDAGYRNHQRIVNGHLHGFAIPTPAKRLFRAFCSHPDQPWPNENFRLLSCNVANQLHDILIECCVHIEERFRSHQRQLQRQQPSLSSSSSHDYSVEHRKTSLSSATWCKFTRQNNHNNIDPMVEVSRPKQQQQLRQQLQLGQSCSKRPRLDTCNATGKRFSKSFSNTSINNDSDNNDVNTPLSFENCKQNCPLDYFFYHNRAHKMTQDLAVNNCTEHFDRGVLIAVCLTNVPGLEALPKTRTTTTIQNGTNHNIDDNNHQHSETLNVESSFVCPEVAIHNATLYEEVTDESSSCPGLICIMAGDQLSTLLGTDERLACLHRVRNNLKRSRLSISYELRL